MMVKAQAYTLEAPGMVNALGTDLATIQENLFQDKAIWLAPHQMRTTGDSVRVGRIPVQVPALPDRFALYQCRNHALAYMAFLRIEEAVRQLVDEVGASRIGVVIGSSTAGVDACESAFFHWRARGSFPQDYDKASMHDMASLSAFIARAAGVKGPAYTVSTACSSSAKVFVSARALLDLGVCDAVITGGVDALCHLTIDGFGCLSTLASGVCNPMSVNRDGLNIGEGAALFLLTRRPGPIRLYGVGESCDAYHISAPDPKGRGALAAMDRALEDAGLQPEQLDYLNLHGTGTSLNDAMEARAVSQRFGALPCSSTKPKTGHCLGSAGAIEVGFCWLALGRSHDDDRVWLPPHIWDGQPDPKLPTLNLVSHREPLHKRGPVYLMSNSFAFGGNNCSVIIGRH